MTHYHYCGCGQTWPCINEACTEEDVCRACDQERALLVWLENQHRADEA